MNEVVVGVRAGALYALVGFMIGFVLGTIRVLLMIPHIGEIAAVLVEAPIMVGAVGMCADGRSIGSVYRAPFRRDPSWARSPSPR